MLSIDSKIEQALIFLIESEFLKKSRSNRRLTTQPSTNKLFAFWDSSQNKWDCGQDIDPLSLYLVTRQPERERSKDDEVIATLALALNRKPAWIHSFINGWHLTTNDFGSISGFLLGNHLQRLFIKTADV